MGTNFAGNIAAGDAWGILSSDGHATLIDVRTFLEQKFVGAPDLTSIGKQAVALPIFDENGQQNPNFMQEIESLQQPKNSPIFFMCHLGGRSLQAAMLVAQMGYKTHNIEHGFCGDTDANGHRSCINGWVASGLPWRQS